jgi:hypothetical protein
MVRVSNLAVRHDCQAQTCFDPGFARFVWRMRKPLR